MSRSDTVHTHMRAARGISRGAPIVVYCGSGSYQSLSSPRTSFPLRTLPTVQLVKHTHTHTAGLG